MSHSTDDSAVEARLSRISTRWSLVAAAHGGSDEASSADRQSLFERYSAASYQYLLGSVRDAEAAEELCHELAVRVLRGDFHRADAGRGRFRDYLKKALINLVNDYHRERRDQPRSLPADGQLEAQATWSAAERSFDDCLREEFLTRTWTALLDTNATYHDVLHLRVFDPDLSSREIAQQINRRKDKQLTADTIRKTLERARAKFAELLLSEVAHFSQATSTDDVRSELQHLDLLKYCQSALERWLPPAQTHIQ